MYEQLLHMTLNNKSRLQINGYTQYLWYYTLDVKQQIEAVS